MPMSLTQRRALAILPKFGGSFSLVGSSFIIYDVQSDKRKRKCVYSRIMFAMSCLDCLSSFWYTLSTWPIPEENENNVPYATGNQHSCTAQGFFLQLGIGIPMYNTMLAFYYLFVIALKWPDHRIQKAEKYMHFIVFTLSSGIATAGLPLTLYNNATLWCWIASVPMSCATSSKSLTMDDCDRGNNAWIYRWALFYAPLWFMIVVVTIIMTIITYFVWKTEKASIEFSATRKGGKRSKLPKTKSERKLQEKETLSKQVFMQAIYYVMAFYVTWLAPTTLRLLQTIDKPVPYVVFMLMALLLPMQGFFNFCVYVRPRIIRYQTKHPKLCYIQIVKRILFDRKKNHLDKIFHDNNPDNNTNIKETTTTSMVTSNIPAKTGSRLNNMNDNCLPTQSSGHLETSTELRRDNESNEIQFIYGEFKDEAGAEPNNINDATDEINNAYSVVNRVEMANRKVNTNLDDETQLHPPFSPVNITMEEKEETFLDDT